MTDIIDTVQLQEVGAIIELYELTFKGQTIYLYSGLDQGDTTVYFGAKSDGAPIAYVAFPLEVTGFEKKSDGPIARPTLVCANVVNLTRTITAEETDASSILDSFNLERTSDLVGATLVRRVTLEENLTTNGVILMPIEFPSSSFVIDRVSSENQVLVTFELASPLDIEGVKVPHRTVVGAYCSWLYQGQYLNDGGCRWALDSSIGSMAKRFIDINDEVIDHNALSSWATNTAYTAGTKVLRSFTITTKYGDKTAEQVYESTRPSQGKSPETNSAYWTRLDLCGKTLNSCKARFDPNDEDLVGLPFGGFPVTRRIR